MLQKDYYITLHTDWDCESLRNVMGNRIIRITISIWNYCIYLAIGA